LIQYKDPDEQDDSASGKNPVIPAGIPESSVHGWQSFVSSEAKSNTFVAS
jgi:hypothetical protein